ncbi:hypothetical protein ACFX2B_045631 [Malus domestica]
MWWSQTIPPSLLALPTQSFHLNRWGHPPRQAKLKDGLKSLLKKLHKKHTSLPRVRQSERGQSSSCQPSKQHERVEDDEISTHRSSIPITMRDFFPEDFFNYSVKAPCYEDCEERLSQIA